MARRLSRINPKAYQVIVNGKPVLVSDLTEDQLRQELCQALYIIETLDNHRMDAGDMLNEWRKGS